MFESPPLADAEVLDAPDVAAGYLDGPTSDTNLAALCQRHHRAKHHAGWTVHRNPDTGQSEWTSPTGHEYTSRPDPLPADTTSDPDPPPF